MALLAGLLAVAWTYNGVGYGGSTAVPYLSYAWSGETNTGVGASLVRVNPCPFISGSYTCYPNTIAGLSIRVSGYSYASDAYSYHQIEVSGSWSSTQETYDAY